MKKFSIFNEAKSENQLDIQDNTINYISVEDLKKYLSIADKYLSQETKEIINWLIVNNQTYLHDLDPEMEADNALAAFYNKGVPKQEDLKELYKCIGTVKKSERLLEIPVFQTKEQFNDIINKKMSPDEILLDLKTEKGRSKVVSQYQPLIYKIVRQWIGKSKFGVDDLYSIALVGITYAMNSFGHKKVRGENGKWVEVSADEKTASYTFTQYAAYCINNAILEEIKHNSHLVRIPASQQSKDRKEKGFNIKNISISGSKKVGHDSDGNGKTLFDYVDSGENGFKDVDSEDLKKLWATVYDKLEKQFKKRDLEIFYSLFGLNDYKKIKGKDIATKYNVVPSAITSTKTKIINFIKKDKQLWDIFKEILAIVGEAMQDKYNEEDQYLEAHSISNIKNTDNDE